MVLDKAGAYGIQDESSTNHFVKATEGDVTNVVGLPVEKLASVLNDMEVNKKMIVTFQSAGDLSITINLAGFKYQGPSFY